MRELYEQVVAGMSPFDGVLFLHNIHTWNTNVWLKGEYEWQ